jgi:hypothetical protein
VHEKFDEMRGETATTATQKEQTTPEATRDYLQDEGGTGWLIDNHYMAQAMSDEPIDLGMCKKVHLLSGPHLLTGQGKRENNIHDSWP